MSLRTFCVKNSILLGFLATFGLTSSAEVLAQNNFKEAVELRNRSAVSVISGGISGTYARFATDMANVLDNVDGADVRVLPIVGRGGAQNMLDLLFLKGVDMAIAQQDHLAFLKKENKTLYGNVDRHIRLITKLYNAEFHLVARREFQSLDDLDGETVNLWKPWSSTDIAGRTIFNLMEVDAEIINIDTRLALEKVRAGEIAATTLLAGAPITGYKDITADAGLHFVQIDPTDPRYAKLLQIYLPANLKHEDYPGLIPQGQTVKTIASGAVLATYNWKEGSEQYKKMAKFVESLFDNFEGFREAPRHPKWRDINLAADVPGWTRFKPAAQWLATNATAPDNEIKTAFSRFLTSFQQSSGLPQISEQQKSELFDEFVRWYNTSRQ